MRRIGQVYIFITLGIVLIALIIWDYFRRNRKVSVDLAGYTQDLAYKTEFDARPTQYLQSPTNSLFELLTSNYVGFDPNTYSGVFPVYSKSSSLFTAELRASNRKIAQDMITNYNKLVTEASNIHKVPRILIYAIMMAEHERSVPLKQAESYSRPGSQYIGMMQISATTATDSIGRNIKFGRLTDAQIGLFKQKGLITEACCSDGKATVKVTSQDLRKIDINIHAGAEYISRHINSWGIYQPEKIVVSYNQGEGALRRDGLMRASSDSIFNFYNGKTTGQIVQVKGYLLKTLGKHGACDILFNDLGIRD